MKASEAIQLTIEGQGGMKYIFSQIEKAAKSGLSRCSIYTIITNEQKTHLKSQGFTVMYDSVLLQWVIKW